jgi:hypothetical protein
VIGNAGDVAPQRVERDVVRLAPGPNGHVDHMRSQERQQIATHQLSQAALEPIAVDRGVMVFGHDDPDS